MGAPSTMASTEPPPPSGRSIYERIGLHPVNPTRLARPTRPARPPRTGGWKYLAGLAVLLAFAAIWYATSGGASHFRSSYAPPDEDQRRMDMQQAQIEALRQRTEMLEVKVQALQQMAGYETLSNQRLPAIRDPFGPSPKAASSRSGAR